MFAVKFHKKFCIFQRVIKNGMKKKEKKAPSYIRNKLIFVKIPFLNRLILETQKRSFADIVQVCCVGYESCSCEVSALGLFSVSRTSMKKTGKIINFEQFTKINL